MTDTPPHTPPIQPDHPPRPTLRFDWRDWLPYLKDSDIPEDQKREWIETLWSIVIGFVDLGWEVKSTAETCGEEIDLKAVLEATVVNSENNKKTKQEAADDR